MSTNFKLKRSNTPGAIPSSSSLSDGEVALNTHDGSLFLKQIRGSDSSIIDVAGRGVSTGSGAPSSTPTSAGSIYVDSVNDIPYFSTGISSSSDWKNLFDRTNHSGKIEYADLNLDSTVHVKRLAITNSDPELDFFDVDWHASGKVTSVIRWDFNDGTFGAQIRSFDSGTGNTTYVNNVLAFRTDSFGMDRATFDMDSHSIIMDKGGATLRPSDNNTMDLGTQSLRFSEGFLSELSLMPGTSNVPTLDNEVTFSSPSNSSLTFAKRGSDTVVRTFEVPSVGLVNKLGSVDSNATDDQTGSEIIALIDSDIGTSWKSGGASGGDGWGDPVDSDIIPNADSTIDLGSSSNRFANLHVNSIDLNGVTLDGTTLSDPGADRILGWDNSASSTAYFSVDGLAISGSTISVDFSDPKITYGVNAQTGTAYTLVLSDQNLMVTMDNASANTLTIPTNASVAFPVGAIISVTMLGAGVTTVTGDTGVTVNGVSAGSADFATQYAGATLSKIATDTWLLQGNIGAVS